MIQVHLGLIVADPAIVAKINEKHHISVEDVREALQYPAQARFAEETHEVHGWRVLAVGANAQNRRVFAALLPLPPWAGLGADTWTLKTARWIDGNSL